MILSSAASWLSVVLAAGLSAAPQSPSRAPASVPGAAPASATRTGPFKTDNQRALYALGLRLGANAAVLGLSASEMRFVSMGFEDAALGRKPRLNPDLYSAKLQALVRQRMARKVAAQKAKDKAYLAKEQKKALQAGGQVLPSGVVYIPIKKGTGQKPTATDTVVVQYEGRLTDGTIFDSSYKRGSPAKFPLGRVIPCWTQGVALMRPGGSATLVCPSDTAYGDRGSPPIIPGGATLTFKVELQRVIKGGS